MRFGLFSVLEQDFARVARKGFTHVGPDYSGSPDIAASSVSKVEYAGEHDLNFHYRIPFPAGYDRVSMTNATEAEIRGAVSDQIITSDVIDTYVPAIEELRHWYANEVLFGQIWADAVAVEAGAGVKTWCYEPNNRTSESMEITSERFGIVGKGCYMTNMLNRAEVVRQHFDEIVGAANALGSLPMAVLELSKNFNINDSFDHLRHDVYLAIVRGVRAFHLWSGWSTRPGFTEFEVQFEAYGDVATQLNGQHGVGDIFTSGDVVPSPVLAMPTGVNVATFEYGGDKFTLVVNSLLNEAVVYFTEAVLMDEFSNRVVLNDRRWVMDPLGVALIRTRV